MKSSFQDLLLDKAYLHNMVPRLAQPNQRLNPVPSVLEPLSEDDQIFFFARTPNQTADITADISGLSRGISYSHRVRFSISDIPQGDYSIASEWAHNQLYSIYWQYITVTPTIERDRAVQNSIQILTRNYPGIRGVIKTVHPFDNLDQPAAVGTFNFDPAP